MTSLDTILRGLGQLRYGRVLYFDVLVGGVWVGPVTPDEIHQRPELHHADGIRVAESVVFS